MVRVTVEDVRQDFRWGRDTDAAQTENANLKAGGRKARRMSALFGLYLLAFLLFC